MATPLLALLLAVSLAPPPAPAPALSRTEGYQRALARLTAARETLSTSYRSATSTGDRQRVLTLARAQLLSTLEAELIPAWFGTAWDFNGTSERPGEGLIACGYFVTTVLRDAGFRVQRVRLAQQASEQIVQSLSPEPLVTRHHDASRSQVVERVRRRGDGLYVIGLDCHVGFLVLQGPSALFCHANYLGARQVVCEDAATAPAMGSRYTVVGDALGDGRIVDWLLGRAIPTRSTRPTGAVRAAAVL